MSAGNGHAWTPARRLMLALLWLVLLAVAGWAVGQRLQLSGDLRKFMPRKVGNGPATHPQATAAADGIRLRAIRTRDHACATV